MPDNYNSKNWYVLYTRSRCEVKVDESLQAKGITTYLPVKTTIKQWSDRKKEITQPIFPGYVFIYVTEKERLLSLEDKHVVRCLCDAGRPAVVPEWQIDSLQKMIIVNPDINVIEGLYKGTEIEINSGPFKGIRGVVAEIDSKNHLAISIELINRTVMVSLPAELVISFNN
jgi:transcription antitermination factor NusG